MKKIKSLNNKGFVLVETMIVAVAVAAIFAVIFKHFYPLIGEYNRREDYDDIDSKYGTYWIKRIIQHNSYELNKTNIDYQGYEEFSCANIKSKYPDGASIEEKQAIDNEIEQKRQMCRQLLVSLEVNCDKEKENNASSKDKINKCPLDKSTAESSNAPKPHIYITQYNLSKFKEVVKNNTERDVKFSSAFQEYVHYLPTYEKALSLNQAKYRIIIEYYRHRFDTPDVEGDANSYVVDDEDYNSYATIEVKK